MLKTLRRRVDAVSLPSRPLHGCASTMMAVFCPQHVSRSPSDQYCCQKCCVWCWTPLYLSLARFPTWGRGPCISHICVCFSLSLLLCVSFSLDFFFPFHFFTHPIVASLSLFLTTYALTESIGWYLFSPPCHISITRQNGYGLLLGSHLHISLSYIFQKVVRGFHSFSMLLWGLQ